jgi:hypothetical protein
MDPHAPHVCNIPAEDLVNFCYERCEAGGHRMPIASTSDILLVLLDTTSPACCV